MPSECTPPILHIVGRKRAGKTALIVKIIHLFSEKGYRIAGVRHSPHLHTLDTKGTDTDAFKRAGAIGSGLITSTETNIFLASVQWHEKISHIRRAFRNCHLIVVEGGIKNSTDKIEVVPEGKRPLSRGDQSLRAIVGHEQLGLNIPAFQYNEVEKICAFIEESYLKPKLSGAIIAGGKSSRLGTNKALVKIGGKTLIERVIEVVSHFVSSVKVITNTPSTYQFLEKETAVDIRPGCGPMSGIHTALSLSPTEYVLVVSCDVPLLKADTLKPLLSAYPGFDITLFKHKQFEPLCAVYRRTCLPVLEELIDNGEYRVIDLFPTLQVKVIRIEAGDVFKSINTREDYHQILQKFTAT